MQATWNYQLIKYRARTTMEDRTDTDPIVGFGVRCALNRHWSINLEGSYLTKSEVSLLTFGGRYQF
jgi:hypothetical protein